VFLLFHPSQFSLESKECIAREEFALIREAKLYVQYLIKQQKMKTYYKSTSPMVILSLGVIIRVHYLYENICKIYQNAFIVAFIKTAVYKKKEIGLATGNFNT
jgi:hypothetical protein